MSEATTSDAAARVQLVQAPITAPGSCALCGKSEHVKGFATADNLDFEFFGRFYLCGDCVGDFAKVFGWVDPIRYAEYVESLTGLEVLNAQLLHELETLGAVRDAVDRYNNSDPPYDNVDSSPVHVSDDKATKNSNDDSIRVSEQEPTNVSGLSDSTTESEPNTTELVSEQGPVSVPGVTSDVAELLGEYQ